MIWFAEEFSSIGDKILLQTPVYPPFHDLVKNNGRQLVFNEMDLINGRYEINFEDLERKLADPKVKILFICNADIIFDGHEFVPFCGISEEFANHSVTFINPAKTFNVAGFRTAAWFTHNEEIYRRMMNQQTYKKGMGRNIFGNVALMACYNHGDDYADQCVAYLNETKNQAVAYINENIPKIHAVNPEATLRMPRCY